MLFAFLDESGIGDLKTEVHMVIAGVIVSDHAVPNIERRIAEIRDKHVPEKYRSEFIFHAADLYQGNDKKIPKDLWPTRARRIALEDLMKVATEFSLPVAQSHVPRNRILRDRSEMTADQVIRLTQAIAATTCMLHIERFARLWADSDDQVTLIYENNDRAKEAVRKQHEFISSPEFLSQLHPKLYEQVASVIPVRRVVDRPQFAKKNEAPILQLADACAYMIRRATAQKECEQYVRHIRHLVITNREGNWTLGKPRRAGA